MVSQYLSIHFVALNPIIKEILSRNPKLATYDPSLSPKGGVEGGNLTGYLDSLHMVSQYLPIYFVVLNPIIKEILSKNPKLATYDPSLSLKGGSEGKSDRLFRLSTYGFPIPPNIFRNSKSNNKGDIMQKPQISHLGPQFEP